MNINTCARYSVIDHSFASHNPCYTILQRACGAVGSRICLGSLSKTMCLPELRSDVGCSVLSTLFRPCSIIEHTYLKPTYKHTVNKRMGPKKKNLKLSRGFRATHNEFTAILIHATQLILCRSKHCERLYYTPCGFLR